VEATKITGTSRTASGSDENYTNCKFKIRHELQGWKFASTRTASESDENYTNSKSLPRHELQVKRAKGLRLGDLNRNRLYKVLDLGIRLIVFRIRDKGLGLRTYL